MLEFAAYAKKALAEDSHGTPGRLFYALIGAWDGRITNEQEDRALARFPSFERGLIVYEVNETLQRLTAPAPEPAPSPLLERNIGFLPAATVQCFFPQERLPDGEREWSVSHGNTTLEVSAGRIAVRSNPQKMRTARVPHDRLTLMPYCAMQLG